MSKQAYVWDTTFKKMYVFPNMDMVYTWVVDRVGSSPDVIYVNDPNDHPEYQWGMYWFNGVNIVNAWVKIEDRVPPEFKVQVMLMKD